MQELPYLITVNGEKTDKEHQMIRSALFHLKRKAERCKDKNQKASLLKLYEIYKSQIK